MKRSLLFVALPAASLLACNATRPAQVPDGFVCDGPTCVLFDAGAPDISTNDTGTSDISTADAGDAGASDVSTSDTGAPDISPDGAVPDAGVDDATPADAAVEKVAPTLTLALLAPSGPVVTNGVVHVSVVVSPPVPVTLSKGSSTLVVLGGDDGGAGSTPTDGGTTLTWDWDTSSLAEGLYSLTATASLESQVVASQPIAITVDRTAPTVIDRTPANGNTNVPIADPITIRLSEPVAPSTFSPTAVSLVNVQTIVPATSQLSADGLKITVTPTSPISLPASMSASLSAPLADKAGNKVVLGTWSWALPAWVQYPMLVAWPTYAPALAVDPSTNRPIVAGVFSNASDTTRHDLVVRAAGPAATWVQPPYPVPPSGFTTGSSLSLQPFLGMTSTGPVVGWVADTMSYVAAWANTSWSPFTPPPASAQLTAFTLDKAGAPYITWGATETYVAHWNASTTTWSPLFGIAPVSATSSTSQLRIDAAGQPAFAAEALYRYVAGSWLPITWPAGLSDTGTQFCFDVDGRPIVGTTTGTELQLVRYDSNTWQPWGPTLPYGHLNRFQIACAPASAGAVVAFTDQSSIIVARLTQAGSWETLGPAPAVPNSLGEPINLRLVVGADGRPSLAFQQYVPAQSGHILSVVTSNR